MPFRKVQHRLTISELAFVHLDEKIISLLGTAGFFKRQKPYYSEYKFTAITLEFITQGSANLLEKMIHWHYVVNMNRHELIQLMYPPVTLEYLIKPKR